MTDMDNVISLVSDIFDDDRKLLERKAKAANDLFNLLADHEISIEKETEARETDYEKLNSQLSAYESEIKAQKEQIANLTEQNNKLRTDKEQIQADYEKLRADHEKMKNFMNELNKRKLDKRDKEAQQRGQTASRELRTAKAEERNNQMAKIINNYLNEFKRLSPDQLGDIKNTIDWADLVNRTKIPSGHAIYKDFVDWLQGNIQHIQGNLPYLYHYYLCRRINGKHDLFKNVPKV